MRVKIIRSAKRKRTVNARMINEVIHLYLPGKVSKKQEQKYIAWAKKRFQLDKRKKKLLEKNGDKILQKRTQMLNRKYFAGKLKWKKIYFSVEQNHRMFGNCDTKNKSIRISDRLLKMPKFVLDYVIVHELTHLIVPKHGLEFWKICNRYSKTERARGYLIAVAMND